MRNILIFSLLIIGLTLNAQNNTPSKIGFAVGGSLSTNGIGAQAAVSVGNALAVRVLYETIDRTFPDAFQYSISDIDLNITPTWKTGGISAMVDLYLMSNFYLTGGIVQTNMDLSAKLMPAESMQIGDITWEPEDIGDLTLSIKPLEKMAPYAGIGFGRNISRKRGLAMSLEFGAYYMKSYVIGLSGTGMFAGNSDNESINRINETLAGFDWSGIYPVIKLGISFRAF